VSNLPGGSREFGAGPQSHAPCFSIASFQRLLEAVFPALQVGEPGKVSLRQL
jgi:hypothetical protein